ncbi:MAG TPA: DNA repair protein RadC [Steroidobacteraceae bacterium]|nr:DNA repair protein RadC [Steroidobacteraceae bacterium]
MSAPEQLALPLSTPAADTPLLFGRAAPESEPAQLLLVRDESDRLRAATAAEIIAAARRAMTRRVRRGVPLASPCAVRDFLAVKLGALEYELFAVLLLDTRHRLIDYVELFRGTVDKASVHPREVVKLALERNASALVLAHPHPSGAAEPSQADELITRRLKEALELVDIRVLDHIIVAGGETVSFSERGLL